MEKRASARAGATGGETKRRDPEVRSVDGTASWARLTGRDPERHYVWVYKGSHNYGPDYYESIGYDVEIQREGGPQFMGKRPAGSTMEYRGHVLMSCTKARLKEIEQYGVDGDSGQQTFDRIEQKMLKKEVGIDPLRGIRGQVYAYVENDEGHTGSVGD